MSVKFISPEELDLLYATLIAVNPGTPTAFINNPLQLVSIANQVAYSLSYHPHLPLKIEQWKAPHNRIPEPAIPALYEGSLLRWVDHLFHNCISQDGTSYLPERIEDDIYGLLPAFGLRNQRQPGSRTSDEIRECTEEACLRAIREGNDSLAAIHAIWLYRLAHAQNLTLLGHPELSQRRKTTYRPAVYHQQIGYMATPVINDHRSSGEH